MSAAPLLSIEAALAQLTGAIATLPAQRLPLVDALGRVTAYAVHSECDLPPFDQAAMDGYAVRAADIACAPVGLPLTSIIAAGVHAQRPELPAGTAARIYTGGLVPIGADTIVRQEITERNGDQVVFLEAVPAATDVRPQGDELRCGARLVGAGQRLGPGLIAALATAGVAQVSVHRRPRIAVLITGDEIVSAGRPLLPGQVYDANGPLLRAWCAAQGYPEPLLIDVADEVDIVRAALQRACAEADLVISTGGVSVGDRDLIAPEAEKLGAQRLFWKVAQKPGKPLYVAHLGDALLMGLPGNPASVLVNLAVFVRRALDVLEGMQNPGPAFRTAQLAEQTSADAKRVTWLRVRKADSDDGVLRLRALGHQASHMLSNLAEADALAWLPVSSRALPAGYCVQYLDLA